jgi:hypothetical protein
VAGLFGRCTRSVAHRLFSWRCAPKDPPQGGTLQAGGRAQNQPRTPRQSRPVGGGAERGRAPWRSVPTPPLRTSSVEGLALGVTADRRYYTGSLREPFSLLAQSKRPNCQGGAMPPASTSGESRDKAQCRTLSPKPKNALSRAFLPCGGVSPTLSKKTLSTPLLRQKAGAGNGPSPLSSCRSPPHCPPRWGALKGVANTPSHEDGQTCPPAVAERGACA